MTRPAATQPLAEVRLLDLPLDLHERASAHTDGLLREFRLLLEQVRDHDTEVPARLLELVRTVSDRYSGVSDEQEELLDQAFLSGRRVYEQLDFRVPPDVGPACVDLARMLDEADDYCRRGEHLLMLATPSELVRYRNWYLREFARQVQGAPPVPWPAYGDERPA